MSQSLTGVIVSVVIATVFAALLHHRIRHKYFVTSIVSGILSAIVFLLISRGFSEALIMIALMSCWFVSTLVSLFVGIPFVIRDKGVYATIPILTVVPYFVVIAIGLLNHSNIVEIIADMINPFIVVWTIVFLVMNIVINKKLSGRMRYN